jgi:ABC-type anion transport system duplicated permease subunit
MERQHHCGVLHAGRKDSDHPWTRCEQITAATANGQFPIILLGTILISMVVVTTNRLVWRPLYRLAETRYRLDG